MSAVRLTRVDPAANMARFYRLDVQPSLFGFSSVYEWGRIGRPGRLVIRVHETEAEALAAIEAKRRKKERGGYGEHRS